jgi:hypothetical protein
VAEHPMTAALRAAAEQQPLVIEAQMPAPSPAGGWTGLQCGWIRVGLRDPDITCLAEFLHAVRDCTAAIRPRSAQPGVPYVIAVKTVSEGEPRILSGELPALPGPAAPIVLASDLDGITALGGQASEAGDARTWRVMAICENYRTGIVGQLVNGVSQEMHIAGMTYALLQGKSVLFLLGHHPDGEAGLPPAQPNANVNVVHDEWLGHQRLGWAGPEPLLSVHVRSPNRPGTTLDVLNALKFALEEERSLKLGGWNVWHARTDVTAGNLALIRFTLRLSVEPEEFGEWNPATCEAIERSVKEWARRRRTANAGSSGAIEELLVSIQLISPIRTLPR